jgi:hypothetical protein
MHRTGLSTTKAELTSRVLGRWHDIFYTWFCFPDQPQTDTMVLSAM